MEIYFVLWGKGQEVLRWQHFSAIFSSNDHKMLLPQFNTAACECERLRLVSHSFSSQRVMHDTQRHSCNHRGPHGLVIFLIPLDMYKCMRHSTLGCLESIYDAYLYTAFTLQTDSTVSQPSEFLSSNKSQRKTLLLSQTQKNRDDAGRRGEILDTLAIITLYQKNKRLSQWHRVSRSACLPDVGYANNYDSQKKLI